jgi:hypothetical protein
MYLNPYRNQLIIVTPGHSNGLMTYISPFSSDMWLAIFVMIIICSLILALTSLCAPDTSEHFDITHIVMIILNGLLLQGTPFEPKKNSSKIAFYVVFMFGLFLYAGYSACLTSFLAVKKITLPFQDVESLLYESDFNITTVSGSAYEDMFRVNKNWLEHLNFKL